MGSPLFDIVIVQTASLVSKDRQDGCYRERTKTEKKERQPVVDQDSLNPDQETDPDPAFQVNPDPGF